ncbi:hypothetical protein [Jannaschia seohaensis]|nr:hypothetical protein [Jannaschia seohaensis]
MMILVIPALAAAGILFVWKGPGAEIVLSRLEPLMADIQAPDPAGRVPARAAGAHPAYPVNSTAQTRPAPSPVPVSRGLPGGSDCASVRRGMGNGIVFHRAGACPDGS